MHPAFYRMGLNRRTVEQAGETGAQFCMVPLTEAEMEFFSDFVMYPGPRIYQGLLLTRHGCPDDAEAWGDADL